MSTVNSPQETAEMSAEKQEKMAKKAAAKEQLRIAYEAKTTARNCLGCNTEFRSEGAHHRLCNRCRSRR